MGSAPQQASSPMSGSSLATQSLARALPQTMMSSQINGQSPQFGQLPSGMAPPAQPQSLPTMGTSAPSGGMATMGTSAPQGQATPSMAPITQQLQQAIQPGSVGSQPMQSPTSFGQMPGASIGGGPTASQPMQQFAGDSYVGQMQQQPSINNLAMLLSQWGL